MLKLKKMENLIQMIKKMIQLMKIMGLKMILHLMNRATNISFQKNRKKGKKR